MAKFIPCPPDKRRASFFHIVNWFKNLLIRLFTVAWHWVTLGDNRKRDENDTHTSTHTSTRTSTHTSFDETISVLSENIKRLIVAIGTGEMSVKEMMEKVGLKNRPNFLEYSLTPALQNGLVTTKFPNSPRHPRQKYLLTVKGLAVYDQFSL